MRVVGSASAAAPAVLHAVLAYSAFLSALVIGVGLHYSQIVRNEFFASPDEWFPSVSATIGDWFPERNVFQLLIALTSGPRIALILLSYLVKRRSDSSFAGCACIIGLLRTLSAGGWIYVTSSDSGSVHDFFMLSYILLTFPWMYSNIVLAPSTPSGNRNRKIIFALFTTTLGPLVYFYIQHKVHRIAGAYSIYAIFEWSLIFYDVTFDAIAISDFAGYELHIVDTSEPAKTLVVSGPYPIKRMLISLGQWHRSTRLFSVECFFAMLFWTHLTSMGPMIFYSAVWAMGLSGYEILLFISLTPGLLSLRDVRRLFLPSNQAWIDSFVRIVLVSGSAGYMIDDEGLGRLCYTSFAVGVGYLGWFGRYFAEEGLEERKTKSLAFLVGLVATVLLKFANFSLNPFWNFMDDGTGASQAPGLTDNGGFNAVGLVLGALAFILGIDSSSKEAGEGTVVSGAVVDAVRVKRTMVDGAKGQGTVTPPPAPTQSRYSTLISSLSFGSLFFLVHLLFTDSGTIVAYAATGRTIPPDSIIAKFSHFLRSTPPAMPFGILTVSSMLAGIHLSQRYAGCRLGKESSLSIEWSGFAFASLGVFLVAKGFVGFVGGLGLGVWLFSLWDPLLEGMHFEKDFAKDGRGLGLKLLLSFTWYVLLELASTFTAAYAFVPGGNVFRERDQEILVLCVGIIGLGVTELNSRAVSTTTADGAPKDQPQQTAQQYQRLKTSLLLLFLLSFGIASYRNFGYFVVHRTNGFGDDGERIITAGIWTMHFSLDGRMWESQRRIKAILEDAQVDIIGFLESDLQRIVMGNRDMTQFISTTSSLVYSDLGPSPSSSTWGCALLSRFPILNSTHHLLPSPNGELAPAIHATLNVNGTLVDVVVAHNGQEEDPLDRQLQSQELGWIMRSTWPRPVIFLGYVVTTPGAEKPSPYRYLVEDGLMLDIAPEDDDRWCEYILYRGLERLGYARISRGSNPAITDTELQLGRFKLPAIPLSPESMLLPPSNTSSTSPKPFTISLSPPSDTEPPQLLKSTSRRVPSMRVPPRNQFPSLLYGEGVRGHRFHVLTETGNGDRLGPWYYLEDEEIERLDVEALAAIPDCPQQ